MIACTDKKAIIAYRVPIYKMATSGEMSNEL